MSFATTRSSGLQECTSMIDPFLFVLGHSTSIRAAITRPYAGVWIPISGNHSYHMAMRHCLLDRSLQSNFMSRFPHFMSLTGRKNPTVKHKPNTRQRSL